MRLFLPVIAIAIAIGYLLGGRLKRLEWLRLRRWGLVVAGLGVQFLPLPEGGTGTDLLVRTGVLALSYGLLLAFALANIRQTGMSLILLGLACNATVIVANGGMPVSEEALRDSGQVDVIQLLREEGAAKHHRLDDDDVLTPLADVIPVPAPIRQVVSIGDVFVYAGLIWLIASAMRAPIPSWSPTAPPPARGKHRRGTKEATAELPAPPRPPPAATRSGNEP
jgi:hypothetical protein